MSHVVQCVKFGQELPGLEKLPFPGELGQKIYDNVSQQAWKMWLDHQVNLINHNGLVLADPRARQFLMEQLEAFFFASDATDEDLEGWTPPRQGKK
jgi:Fe-S cluster biosynthesis and repair protein YggX